MADTKTSALTPNTAPATGDFLPLLDTGTTTLQNITLANFFKVINGFTADATPDGTADYVVTYDNSATAAKKVLLENVGGFVLLAESANDTGLDPADATTYYFGSFHARNMGASATFRSIYVPRTCQILSVDLLMTCTAGTSETSTMSLRKNDTTDTTITSSIDLSATTYHENVQFGTPVSMTLGDYFCIKWVSPTWSTNPTGVRATAICYCT